VAITEPPVVPKLVTVVYGAGICTSTVPVWPGTLGVAIVETAMIDAPSVLKLVTVANSSGTSTITVPVWPTTVGVAIVDVIGVRTPTAGFRDVIVVN
jgi:hypothetical protein